MQSKYVLVLPLVPKMKYLKGKKQPLELFPVLRTTHTEPLFKKLQVLPLPDLITFSKLQFMHRFSQKFLPSSFNDTWIKNSIRNIGENEIQLQNFNQLQHAHSSLSSLDVFPLYNFPKLWQEFPDEQIKIVRKPIEFDIKLKNTL